MTNAQAALIAAASMYGAGQCERTMSTAQDFKAWLDEQDSADREAFVRNELPRPSKPRPRMDEEVR